MYWKQKGNAVFKEGNYLLALQHYDKAIVLNFNEYRNLTQHKVFSFQIDQGVKNS